MAERFRTVLRTFLVLLALGCVSAKRFSIMAPNVFHIGVNERVSVTVFDAGQPVTVKLYLQDYPHRRKTFSEVQAVLPPQKGSNTFRTVKVEPQDLPDTSSVDKQYVYLVAKSDDAHFQFHKEARILLSYRDGIVFIQTDKPIYTPRQTVKIRVIPVDLDMKPSKGKITVAVVNPQGIRVQQWNDLDISTGIISKQLDLGSGIIQGKWTITALYGHQDFHKTSVQFEVREYVLPKFSVKLSVPPYILKTDKYVKVKITGRYTYKEPVVGAADVRLSIVEFNGHVIPLATHRVLLDRSGATTIIESVNTIRERVGEYWFPDKAMLLVQAYVIERATGNRESVVDRSCQFISSPYHIDFKNTPKYFKPGLPFVVKVVVTYPNKQPAISVPVKILATGMHGSEQRNLKRVNPHSGDKTNEYGEAEFVVDPHRDCKKVEITVKTDNQTLTVSQNAVANYTADAFQPGNGPMIMLRQLTLGKVDSRMIVETYRSGHSAGTVFSYLVVSRGQILSHDLTIDSFDGIIRTLPLRVSSDMFPSARLIGYFFDSKERIVADSILLKIEDKLPTQVAFPDAIKIQPNGTQVELNVIEKYPSDTYNFRIKAPQGTRLGLLAVDESVYLLRNENRLTKERILRTAEELDLGCGVGGGKDSQDIFKNAGVVLITNRFVNDGREHYGCDTDVSRKKRSLGVDTDFNSGDEDVLDQTVLRSYYPESWIYDEMVVGPSGLASMYVTIPDAVTTWVIQAVAINNKTGLGLATPLRIVSRKDYFISLKMPYSVKRGEQVSLLATVFNNGEQEIRAKIYLKGSNDFCSFAGNDKHALIGMATIRPNAARSVTVQVLPKRTGKVEVEVSAVFQVKIFTNMYVNSGGDSVRRKLLVEVERGFNETCKFDLNTTLKEIKLGNSGDFAGTVKKTSRKRVKGCKGKYKNKKRCRRKEKKEEKDNVLSIDLKVCTRKKRQAKVEGKSIMDIGILNGFTPERTSVQKLTLNNSVPELDKVEVLDTSLVIYLKNIHSDRELCVNVTFEGVDFVDAVQAVPVNVYDNYEPDQSCSVFYGPTSSLLRLGICDTGPSSCKCSEEPNKIECAKLLRNLLKNPPRYTHIAINVSLSKARYRCREGYVLSGNEMRTCKDGRWSEEKEPKCMGPCRSPTYIPHAKFIGSSFKYKAKLTYVCDKGYMLKGPRMRQCGENRRWSKAPTCSKDYSACGESPEDSRTLLGGRKIMSTRGWWPWQIAIYGGSVEGGKVNELFTGGGALISRHWVLTAAHSFYRGSNPSTNPALYAIKAGVHNLAKREKSEQKMSLKAIVVHENFNPTTFLNDIALVKLSRPVKLTNFVRTVCLQEKSEQDLAIPGTYGIATGWGVRKALKLGQSAQPKDLSNVLHYSSLKIQSDQFCSIRAMPFSINSTVTFCSGDRQRRSGTCNGDGGGAFVRETQRIDGKRRAWVATGIVSWGKGCGQKDEPGYYTKVYPFIDWIKKTMNEN